MKKYTMYVTTGHNPTWIKYHSHDNFVDLLKHVYLYLAKDNAQPTEMVKIVDSNGKVVVRVSNRDLDEKDL